MSQEPYIYIALGSSGGKGLKDVLVDRLLQAGYSSLCISGVAPNERPWHWPSKVLSREYVPGAEVARAATLVISNGGSPTTYQALNVGTPVLGIPANMDQLLCMAHVEDLGCGRLVRPWQVNKPMLPEVVRQLMSGACKTEALQWACSSQWTTYKDRLPELIESLFSTAPTAEVA